MNQHKNPTSYPFDQGINWQPRADLFLVIILLIISVLVLILNGTDTIPTITLLVLGITWILFLLISNRVRLITPLTMPVLSLLCLLPLSLSISVDLGLSLPKVYGIILGVSILFWIVQAQCCYSRLRLIIVGLIILAVGVAALGLISTEWTGSKLGMFTPLYNRLDDAIQLLSINAFSSRINANSMGGALTFFLPLLLALLWDGGAFGKTGSHGKRLPHIVRLLYKITLVASFLLVGVVLFQTQARGAFVGTAVGVLAIAVWKDRRFLWLIPLTILGLITFVYFYWNGDVSGLINALDTSEQNSFSTRLIAWQNALYVLQDFPLTGVGIATYSEVFSEIYTLTPPEMQTAGLIHPHNTLLSVAIDLGIPGLVLYTAMLGSFAAMAWRLIKSKRRLLRTTAIGLACGMLAHQVFGLMDAYVLGRNLGEIFWIFCGCMTALYLCRASDHVRRKTRSSNSQTNLPTTARPAWFEYFLYVMIGIAAWSLITIAAVSLIYLNPILSVSTAILGGAVLGIFLVSRYEVERMQPALTTSLK